MFRRASCDSELDGVRIPRSATLWIMFGSANRDERALSDPDRFDPARKNLKSLALDVVKQPV